MRLLFFAASGSFRRMSEQSTVDEAVVELHSKMFRHRLKVKEVCSRAGIGVATWTRWAAGASPNLGNLRKMEKAVDELIAERAAS